MPTLEALSINQLPPVPTLINIYEHPTSVRDEANHR